MSTEHDDTPTGEHPHALTISGLREIADFLAEHPELPAMRAFVYGRADFSLGGTFERRENPRETLAMFAEALDCRVKEGVSGADVRLEAAVNSRAMIALSASMGSLGGRQRTPQYDYEPITETCSYCTGEAVRDGELCPKCEGAATQLHEAAYTASDFERRAA